MHFNNKVVYTFAFILSFYQPVLSYSHPADSVGIEKAGQKRYILHKVDPKETIYSLSRRYNSTVKDIQSANPGLTANLSIGQIIKIPYSGKLPETGSTARTSASTHTVAAKETYYSISKKYGTTVDLLKKANPEKHHLKVGDELVLPGKNVSKQEVAKEKPKPEAPKPVAPAKQEIAETKPEPKPEPKKENPKKENKPEESEEKGFSEEERRARGLAINKTSSSPANISPYKKTNESGYGVLLDLNGQDLKYLAHHKTAPMGTIIHVENEDTNQKIFVRVIGKIGDDEKILIKLSPKAYERLGGKEGKIPVNLTYIP